MLHAGTQRSDIDALDHTTTSRESRHGSQCEQHLRNAEYARGSRAIKFPYKGTPRCIATAAGSQKTQVAGCKRARRVVWVEPREVHTQASQDSEIANRIDCDAEQTGDPTMIAV